MRKEPGPFGPNLLPLDAADGSVVYWASNSFRVPPRYSSADLREPRPPRFVVPDPVTRPPGHQHAEAACLVGRWNTRDKGLDCQPPPDLPVRVKPQVSTASPRACPFQGSFSARRVESRHADGLI